MRSKCFHLFTICFIAQKLLDYDKQRRSLDGGRQREICILLDNQTLCMKMLLWLLQFRYRTHGNELWEFDDNGLMRRRDMSANDIPILEEERRHRPPTCL